MDPHGATSARTRMLLELERRRRRVLIATIGMIAFMTLTSVFGFVPYFWMVQQGTLMFDWKYILIGSVTVLVYIIVALIFIRHYQSVVDDIEKQSAKLDAYLELH